MSTDGNGGVDPGIPGPAVPSNKVMVLTIYVDKVTQRVEVEGLLGNKTLCLNALAEAIKAIASFEPSPIVHPSTGNRMVNFARKVTRGH